MILLLVLIVCLDTWLQVEVEPLLGVLAGQPSQTSVERLYVLVVVVAPQLIRLFDDHVIRLLVVGVGVEVLMHHHGC